MQIEIGTRLLLKNDLLSDLTTFSEVVIVAFSPNKGLAAYQHTTRSATGRILRVGDWHWRTVAQIEAATADILNPTEPENQIAHYEPDLRYPLSMSLYQRGKAYRIVVYFELDDEEVTQADVITTFNTMAAKLSKEFMEEFSSEPTRCN